MSERIEIRPKNAQLASYHTVSSDEEESASGSSDDENGRGFSDYAWSCASALVPQTDVAWPASFTTSAAFLLRHSSKVLSTLLLSAVKAFHFNTPFSAHHTIYCVAELSLFL